MEDDEQRTPAGESDEASEEPTEKEPTEKEPTEKEPTEKEPTEEPPPVPRPGLTAPLDHVADDEKHMGQAGVLPGAEPEDDRASDDRGGDDG